jgi:hypothetical protein
MRTTEACCGRSAVFMGAGSSQRFYRGRMNGEVELPEDSGPSLNAVEVEAADGIWVLIYGAGPDFPVLDTSFVPAALTDGSGDMP